MLYINNKVFHIVDGSLKHAAIKGDAVMVQADGDELERIRATFTGIPMPLSRVVRWDGEWATFIARHLT